MRRQQFQFLNVCTRCASAGAAKTWDVRGPTKVTKGPAATVYTTPVVVVPICSSCWWSMMATKGLLWIVGIALGVITFFAIKNLDAPGMERELLATGIIVGLIVMGLGAGLGELFMKSELTVGRLDPERETIVFHNRDYQRMFDLINLVPGADLQSPGGAAAAEGLGCGTLFVRSFACLVWAIVFFFVAAMAISMWAIRNVGDDPKLRTETINAAADDWSMWILAGSFSLAVVLGCLGLLPGTRRKKR